MGTPDLVASSSLMLMLAVTIAKAHQLEASDWKDINDACSNAVRALPACYRLQRALPGALNVARAWRHLPEGPEDGSDNPWASPESQALFENMYNIPWAQIESISETDKEVISTFSGRFKVTEVTDHEGIC